MAQHSSGRRRGKDLEEAIFQAVWDELHEVGFARLTMDGVARRAGTSKPVLYRRWSNRVEMMAATALQFLPRTETVPDTGNVRDNTVEVLKIMRERMRTVGRTAMLGFLTSIAEDPETYEPLRATLLGYMQRIMQAVVIDRGVESGEIPEEPLPDRLTRLPLELARMEFLLIGDLSDESIEEIVDVVFVPALFAHVTSKSTGEFADGETP